MKPISPSLVATTASLLFLAVTASTWAGELEFSRSLDRIKIKNFQEAERVWSRLAAAGCDEAAIYKESITLELAKITAPKPYEFIPGRKRIPRQ